MTATETETRVDFTIARDSLLTALRAVNGALPTRAVQPILQNIYLEVDQDNLLVRATDLDTWIESRVPVKARIASEPITLPGRKLIEIVSKLPDSDVTIRAQEWDATVTCNRSKYNLSSTLAADYPRPAWESESDSEIVLSAPVLCKALGRTTFAAASYDSSSILGGVFLTIKERQFNSVATDGSRMAQHSEAFDGDSELSAIIPAKACQELAKLLSVVEKPDVTLWVDKGRLTVVTEKHTLATRLVSGEYPNYSQLFPETFTTAVEVKRESFLKGLDRASVLSDDRTNLVKFQFEGSTLHIRANTPDLGKVHEQIEIESLSGQDMEVAMNSRYVLDVLSRLDCEVVTLEMTARLKPVVFKTGDFKYLVMPVQSK